MNLEEFRQLRATDGVLSYANYVETANALSSMTAGDTGLPEFRIAMLRNVTVEPFLPALAGEIFAAGFHPVLYLAPFGALETEALNELSDLYSFNPDIVIVFNWLDAASPSLARQYTSLDRNAGAAEANRVVAQARNLIASICKRSSATVLMNNFPLTAEPVLGIFDAQIPDGQTATVLSMNKDLREAVRETPNAYILDLFRLFARLGYANATDERHWQIARAPIGTVALLPLAKECGAFVRAIRGKSKKCLVLDCDNTLWGGTIGEDGMAGIAIGAAYPGSCYRSLQEEILNLHDRGVVLALCSKNNREDVLEVLRDHPDMLLREKHFAAIQVNWDDKVTNIRRIAEELNIGTDSFVFVDDSAFEVGLVRSGLPEVTTVCLPAGAPASYRSRIVSGHFFDSLAYTAEDRLKTEFYAAERERKVMLSDSATLEDYLLKLNIRVQVAVASDREVARIAQLTQKTNQFNATTKRYTEGEVGGFVHGNDADVIFARVTDDVSDLGLVGAAILKFESSGATIDTLLMSCRALGRGVEDAFLAAIVRIARQRGMNRLAGVYLPTPKNAMVANFYKDHGFQSVTTADGIATWEHVEGRDPAINPPSWITMTPVETANAR